MEIESSKEWRTETFLSSGTWINPGLGLVYISGQGAQTFNANTFGNASFFDGLALNGGYFSGSATDYSQALVYKDLKYGVKGLASVSVVIAAGVGGAPAGWVTVSYQL